jgi:hypothetical protein
LRTSVLLSLNILCASALWSQSPPAPGKLSVHWEELTAAEFKDAIARAQGACLLPFGIMEKHGPHLPLGNDLLNVRYAALNAAQQEYAVVFPEYYFGQIFEAKHEPGTVAYSRGLQLQLLQETTDGCRPGASEAAGRHTRGSGGTRGSRITTPVRAPSRRASSASSRPSRGSTGSCRRSAPSKPIRRASGCRRSFTSGAGIRSIRRNRPWAGHHDLDRLARGWNLSLSGQVILRKAVVDHGRPAGRPRSR